MRRAVLLFPLLALPFFLDGAAALAARTPSPDLSFHLGLAPDSVTVGDPIRLTLEAGGPAGATLQLPVLSDSIGPFNVLSAEAPVAETKAGRLRVRQTGSLALFKTGRDTLPSLPLLWVRAPGETLVAYSAPQVVRVRSVLKGDASLKNLHGLKGVVSLARFRWWLWGLIALAALAVAWAAWKYRRLLRRRVEAVLEPAPPPLPPEVAFEKGLEELLQRELPEKGLVKEFYGELSLLFRRYLEDRYHFPAVEETRTEIIQRSLQVPEITENERRDLADWLAEGDMVKFAKMERLLAEARGSAERARAWVRATAVPRIAPLPSPAPEAPESAPLSPPAAPPVASAPAPPAAPAAPAQFSGDVRP